MKAKDWEYRFDWAGNDCHFFVSPIYAEKVILWNVYIFENGKHIGTQGFFKTKREAKKYVFSILKARNETVATGKKEV